MIDPVPFVPGFLLKRTASLAVFAPTTFEEAGSHIRPGENHHSRLRCLLSVFTLSRL
jgi:hypothetical protein